MKNKLWRLTLDTNPEDCNLHCIMCEEHSEFSDYKDQLEKRTGRKRRIMPYSMVRDIVIEAAGLNVKEIIPSTMGEPLLYDHFGDMMDLFVRCGIKMNLTTNGTFPVRDPENLMEMLIPACSDIKISWNGYCKNTAEKIMKGIDYGKTTANLVELVRCRDEYYLQTGYRTRITLQVTFLAVNMREIPSLIKFAAETGVDRVKGHQVWVHFPAIADQSLSVTREKAQEWNEWLSRIREAQTLYKKTDGSAVILDNFLPLSLSETQMVPSDYDCPFLEKELWISAEGKISPCCAPDNLREGLGDFGNYRDISLAGALNLPAYKYLVKHYKENSLCKNCLMRRPL